MPLMTYASYPCLVWIMLGLLTLCFGSLINMLQYRLPLMAGFRQCAAPAKLNLFTPRSFCPRCHTTLTWYDLIPVLGWCLQRGRCRHCQGRIGCRYPLIECASLFYGMFCMVYWGFQPMGYAMLLFGYLGILMVCLDAQYQWLPDSLNYLLLWSGLLLASLHITGVSPSDAIVAAAVAYLLLWVVNQAYLLVRKQHGIGGGDMKCLAACGAWCGLPAVCLLLWFAVVLTLCVAMLRLACKRFQWGQRIAFAPALLFAAFVILLIPSSVLARVYAFIGMC